METKTLEITRTCKLERNIYGDDIQDVSLIYIEHSPDPWYGDSETGIDIYREDAIKIVEFLKEAFNI